MVSAPRSKNKLKSRERERSFLFLAVTVTEPYFPRARSKWLRVCRIAVCSPGLVIIVPELSDLFDADSVATFCSLPGLMPASRCPSHPPLLLHLPWLFFSSAASSVLPLPPDPLMNTLRQSSLTWQQAQACPCSDCPTAWRGNEGSRRAVLLPACVALHHSCHSPGFSN